MTSSTAVQMHGNAITFGELLRQLRKRNGMTQADLAAAVGYSTPFISNLELNQRLPDLQVLAQRFVPALGLQELPQLSSRLAEMAAAARGEHPPQPQNAPDFLDHHGKAERSPSLPLPPTELLGRGQEVRSLCNRLRGQSGRLLTLVGPPGIGKTRLGLAIAENLQAFFRDGLFFVPLAAINNPELVASTIADTLGIEAENQNAPKRRLIEFLRRKELLLLLDNFEQIIAAAPLVAELLAASPGLRVLVTSRERLHLRAEQRYRVPPLEMDSAVMLFVQHAQAAMADFAATPENEALLAEICRQLDCLPLAIELSAARMDLYTPEMLLERLNNHRLNLLSDGPRDLPLQQRTLRNAIQRSYLLLNGREQKLFRSLSVFAGGFEAVAVVELGGDEETLQSLINKSLVQVVTESARLRRFVLLETLRDYAWEQLCSHGEAVTTQRRHAESYLHLAEEAASHMRGPEQVIWFERLALEQANCRAALTSSLSGGQIDSAVRLGIALWRFWEMRGYHQEGFQWLDQLLAQADVSDQRAKLHYGRAMLARRMGNMVAAAESYAACLALWRELGDPRGIASALRGLGFLHFVQANEVAPRPFFEEALALFRALDDQEGIAVTLDNLGYICHDKDEFKRLFLESLALRRRTGNLRGITRSLSGLAHHALNSGDYVAARRYIQEHQQINEELGNQNGVAHSFCLSGDIGAAEGDFAAARLDYEKSVQLCRAGGDNILLPEILHRLGLVMTKCGELDAAFTLLSEALIRYQEQAKVCAVAEVLTSFAGLSMAHGQAGRTLTLAGAAVAICDAVITHLFAWEVPDYESILATARQVLGPQAAASAWAAGQALPLDQAVSFALAK